MKDGYCRMAVFCLFAAVLLAGGMVVADVDKKSDKPQPAQGASVDESQPVPLKPGEWGLLFELGENLFPSMVICTATLKDDGDDADDEFRLGEPWSSIGVEICSPQADCPVKVEISGGGHVKSGVWQGTMPKKGEVYRIFPTLKYDYDKLLSVKQTIPEDLIFKVTINNKAEPEEVKRIQVRPVNDCVYEYTDCMGNVRDVSWTFAAYVNENHPVIEKILEKTLNSGRIDSFAGYQNDKAGVKAEISAIWETLRQSGVHYSSITTTSGEDDYVSSQHVRLIGESVSASQANCADSSVLLASILRKIGLDVGLVILPDHMLIAVSLDNKGRDIIFIETTMIGESSLDEAVASGMEQYEENKDRFDSERPEDEDYHITNIAEARRLGIMPLKDYSAK